MKLWNAYKSLVNRNCLDGSAGSNGLPYWQNRLFAAIMLYILPFSFFALIPGIIMSLVQGLYLLAMFDGLAVLLIAVISLSPGISTAMRKLLFISVFYLTAIFLLYYLGSFGPGLLYLMATTLFTVLIFPKRAAYFSMLINLVICVVFGLALHARSFNSLLLQYSLGSWVAVASNLIVLDAIILFLLPMIFKGLQSTITDLQLLKDELKNEQKILNNTLELLRLKNTELEQFAYMASHDMQEPLRMVSKFLAELEKKYTSQLDDKARRYIHFASDGANRMKKTISDLLEYSIAGKKQEKKVHIDMNRLLKECLEMSQALAGEAQADVTWEDLPVIYAEQMPMQQVFQNLLNNAIKYQKAGIRPRIAITASDDSRYWTFRITDNGIGIKEEHFEKIFVVFQRLHSREEYEGSGIGLAICKKIVERHQGRIRVESTPGTGTSFIFTIKKPLKQTES